MRRLPALIVFATLLATIAVAVLMWGRGWVMAHNAARVMRIIFGSVGVVLLVVGLGLLRLSAFAVPPEFANFAALGLGSIIRGIALVVWQMRGRGMRVAVAVVLLIIIALLVGGLLVLSGPMYAAGPAPARSANNDAMFRWR